MNSTGICIGASSITRVDLERNDDETKIIKIISKSHEGNVRKTFESIIGNGDLPIIKNISITGRKFKNLIRLSSISEPEAVEYAYTFLKEKYGGTDYISCAGGETFTTYQMDSSDKVINVLTGNKCASGTGEFFLQQIKRMGIELEEAMQYQNVDEIYGVSGRCSVFCKSDCTHALNKGQPKESIIAGLCDMMAKRIVENLGENVSKKVWLTGGCSKNRLMVESLKKYIPNLVTPEEAACFEALGCALWALDNEAIGIENLGSVFTGEKKSFSIMSPLDTAKSKVSFKEIQKSKPKKGDRCILGLDVGSTTTKAVVIREKDNAILASVYIKTLGDPIKAAKNCYATILNDMNCDVDIIGMGVTGSGRQIAGLHALTGNIYNEISAHAAAAVYFDPEVDTIFEIGGQDAKYTHIINGVPSDYAMNEACSAGTGSFLEESASEFLGLDVYDIEEIALKSKTPPDFNDQCAAFIGSDIKTAMQENIDVNDIVAGLVYSICKNYLNRVKGNRFVGKKIFMQGGVCYNKAVPISMASLLNREIVVPPEPGLMGSFGIALMVKEKLLSGLTQEKKYSLNELIKREVRYEKPFICIGGNTKCDRKCNVSMINIEGIKYPFGGTCGKYAGVVTKNNNWQNNDIVKLREEMVYGTYSYDINPMRIGEKKVGINRSLLVHTLFPLYYNFFTELGLQVVIPKEVKKKQDAIAKKYAAFCYPVEQAHEYFKELIKMETDYIFLPHVKSMHVENSIPISLTCPFVQGESYYLRTSVEDIDPNKIIAPVLDFSDGFDSVSKEFIKIGSKLGYSKSKARNAYVNAVKIQKTFIEECKQIGREFLNEIEKTGDKAIVLFGRPYNALVKNGNMGVPEKFASRGYKIIPYDFLPLEEEKPQDKMYWSMGQMILKAAKMVSKHPQLFGTFITNFSCGPDSFVVGNFRDTMGEKPSLTLELDSHTADAGIDTRIDAFIDVISNYEAQDQNSAAESIGVNAVYDEKKKKIKTIAGEYISINDPRVKVLIPSMGHMGSRAMAAAFRHIGINAEALQAPTEHELQLGRANSTCKECLPLILTVGSLLSYIDKNKDDNIIVYFMPEAPDPCRFGQYHVYTENLLRKRGVENVALLTLSSGNSYGGLGIKYKLRAWQGVVISDVFEEIYSAILSLAVDKEKALEVFDQAVDRVVKSLVDDNWDKLKKVLDKAAIELSQINLKKPLKNATKAAVVGEIYVRRDGFSRQYLVEKLAEKGIVSKVASVSEWVYYCDYLVKNNLSEDADLKDKLNVFVENFVRVKYEKEIKKILTKSNLAEYHIIDVDEVIDNARDLISPHLSGEAILTIGTAITEVIDSVDGVISIGPFGCMPSRIAEAILNEKISIHKGKTGTNAIVPQVLKQYPNLPLLNIETDGNPFPQVIDIKIEAFALQVNRMNKLVSQLKENSINEEAAN